MEATMKTAASILALVSFVAFGFAGTAHAGEGAARKGQVNVQPASTKAVVAGPSVIKVYSLIAGAKVFVADGDCASAKAQTGTTLPADRIETLTVGAGQVACVASTGDRNIELLWHVQSGTPVSGAALVAKR
jgi:hypothetical protein